MDAACLSSLLAAVVALVAAIAGAALVRGTTAVPAAWWAAAAAAAFAAEASVRMAGGLGEPAALACVRLVVVALSLCPVMSLLGAKRPQHGVWQFIVGSLAGILVLPAASAMLVRPGSPPDVHALQRWFMLVLVLVAVMNFAATRHGLAAGLVAAGQVLLMRAFLPFVETGARAAADLDGWAAGLVASGAAVAALPSVAWPVRAPGGERAQGGNPVRRSDPAIVIGGPYLAIRETLGAAWTLRIAERFNVVAETRGWPCRLRFDGLHVGGDPADEEWHADAIRTARSLLRRFASVEWIRRHGPPSEMA